MSQRYSLAHVTAALTDIRHSGTHSHMSQRPSQMYVTEPLTVTSQRYSLAHVTAALTDI